MKADNLTAARGQFCEPLGGSGDQLNAKRSEIPVLMGRPMGRFG